VTTPPGWFSEAAVSPDGTAVAFVSETEKGSDIFVQDIRGGAPIRLVSDGASNRDPAWFPDGRALAYTSEKSGKRSIWKVPRFGGAPVPILANACQPAISPDGKHIAFVQSTPGLSSRIAVAGLAAPGDVRVLTDKDGGLWEHENPAWSPDSKLICYNDHNDLWLVPARGGRARKLTDDDPNDYCPVWSPDGRHIYFCSTREGTTAIWRIRTGGGAPERVTTGSSSERNPSLSGDGRCLVYDTRAKMAGSIIDRRTGERRPLPQRDYFGEPALSPDGAAVVYCADLEGRLNLWRVRLNDGKPTGWPEKLLETDGMCSNTAWSPDGKWIAYQRMLQEKREVWVIPAAGGTPVQFSGDGGMNAQPEWSPDGRTISFISNRSGTYEIWAAPFKDGARAGEAVQLTHGEDVWGSHCWSPRGDRIAYLREDREGSDLWVMSVTGNTRPRRLTHRAGAVFASWDKASGKILVSAFWGGNRQVVKAVSPEGGGIEPAPNTAPSDPRSGVLEIEASADGRLFAVMERMAGGGVWALQAEKGAF
jgi:Tol biopolymer transport system component